MSFMLFLVSTAFWDLDGTLGYSLLDSQPEGSDRSSEKSDLQKALDTLKQRDSWEMVSSTSQTVRPENIFYLGLHRRTTPGQSNIPLPSHINLQMRLQKLEYYFTALKIFEEDCRKRLLCEISKDPAKFFPLSSAFLDETRYNGEEKVLRELLLASNEGSKLLTYIEAVQRGHNRQECEIWVYRCPEETESMINYESLLIWREVSKWLTIKMVARRQ